MLSLDQSVKVGRSVARARPVNTNAIFDCKVRPVCQADQLEIRERSEVHNMLLRQLSYARKTQLKAETAPYPLY